MAIENVDEVRSHWWPRQGWHPGRLIYTWRLTFECAPQLHQLAERYQSALSVIGGHNPIPAQWLHLTVQSVGFVDEVPEELLDQVTKAVGVRLGGVAPIELSFRRPTVIGEAVVLAPTPAEPLHQLWGEVRNGIADVTGNASTAAEQVKGFRPHVSLTYFNTPGPAQPYIDALSRVEANAVNVNVDRVALIVQNRVLEPEWVYRWDIHTSVPLRAR
ncbi:2'-5' RNA ligase family protein [Nonomuraea guangzhouensis]|uniref:2'-5' RNA ligase family protein n=1 Tax=Nonomuraea guangzhouensis TaxID=1291555 RepID=A0ABW4GYV5_9ACTN|nr:2'-5' RNA ligase family protein [Nonomuraea guangzhouensis]